MTLEQKAKELAANVAGIKSEFPDYRALVPIILHCLIRVHNEALEAAALTVNPGHEHNPNNTPCDGCLLEEASFDVLDLIIHPTPTAEQDK